MRRLVSNPAIPVQVGAVTNYSATEVEVVDGMAFIAGHDDGLRIFDVSNPGSPIYVAAYDTGGYAKAIAARDGLAYVGDDMCGLQIIRDISPPAGVREGLPSADALRLSAHPNPFNPQTVITFDLPRGLTPRVRIFDVNGRLVRTLSTGEPASQGRQEILWDGLDDRGHQLPSGVYFSRVEAGALGESAKLVLVR